MMESSKFSLPPLFTATDILLLVLLGAASAAFYGLRAFDGGGGPCAAVVRVQDQTLGRFDLAADSTLTVSGDIGRVTIVIRGGELWFENASCRQKICEKMGPVHNPGEMVVCAPNRVMARIEGSGRDEDVGGLEAITR